MFVCYFAILPYVCLFSEYDMSGHSGNQAGFMSYLTVLPAVNHGVFLGINSNPGYYSREHITMYIYDLLLGIEPWLTKEDICVLEEEERLAGNHPEQGKNDRKVDKATDFCASNDDSCMIQQQKSATEMLDEYTGSYGNYAYGNLTVTMVTDHLVMTYGEDKVIFNLAPVSGDVFTGTGTDIYWYWELDVEFIREEGMVEAVLVGFDVLAPPTFRKDIDWTDLPVAPELCPTL